LKLAGINDVVSANRFIREVYLPAHNTNRRCPQAPQGQQ
jgi:hypothetical protein